MYIYIHIWKYFFCHPLLTLPAGKVGWLTKNKQKNQNPKFVFNQPAMSVSCVFVCAIAENLLPGGLETSGGIA